MRNLGKLFDIALRVKGVDPWEFQEVFGESSIAYGIQMGDPAVMWGMSGTEYYMQIYGDWDYVQEATAPDPGPEYWAGYVLGYIQWYWCRTFKEIFEIVSLEKLIGMYNPFHEMDITQTSDEVGELLVPENIVRRRRRRLGITQKQLADITDISIASIRAYEQGVIELDKVQGDILFRLSRALGCSIEDLLRG